MANSLVSSEPWSYCVALCCQCWWL